MSEVTYAAQRRAERKPVQITVTLVIEGDEADHVASAIHLSQHGLRLQPDLSLVPGQRVGLLLSDNPNYVLSARVVWLGKADSEKAGQAGVEFLKPLAAPV
jgi:PilZ domain